LRAKIERQLGEIPGAVLKEQAELR
jgi:hypothetical protein